MIKQTSLICCKKERGLRAMGRHFINPFLDEMNSLSINDPGIVDHPEAGDNLYRLKRVVDDYYKKASARTKTGTWKAICLVSTVEYYKDGKVPGFSLSRDLSRPTGMIAVVARIPEIDALIPWPQTLEVLSDAHPLSDMWLSLYARNNRVFRCPLEGRPGGLTEIPAAGDIIEVDFEDRKSKTGAMYLGVVERGLAVIPDQDPSETGEPGEAQSAFSSNSSTASTVADTAASSQSQQMDEEADDAMNDMAAELAASTGMSEEAAKAYVEATVAGEQPPTNADLISN